MSTPAIPAIPAIALEHCTQTFITRRGRTQTTITAVDNLSLTITPGEVVALLGPNGAGKSVTLDIMLGLGSPQKGTCQIFGTTPRAAIDQGRISAALQNGELGPGFTVQQTLDILRSLSPEGLSIDQVLSRVQLNHRRNSKVSKLSGGERQRLRIAAALLPDPDILILDEPTAGMDVTSRKELWELIQDFVRDGHRTVLFATHYLAEASTWADRIIILTQGHIVADGTLAELQQGYESTTITADWSSPTHPPLRLILHNIPDTNYHIIHADQHIELTTSQPDDVARILLNSGHARHLAITPITLDDIFTQLTAESTPAHTN